MAGPGTGHLHGPIPPLIARVGLEHQQEPVAAHRCAKAGSWDAVSHETGLGGFAVGFESYCANLWSLDRRYKILLDLFRNLSRLVA